MVTLSSPYIELWSHLTKTCKDLQNVPIYWVFIGQNSPTSPSYKTENDPAQVPLDTTVNISDHFLSIV